LAAFLKCERERLAESCHATEKASRTGRIRTAFACHACLSRREAREDEIEVFPLPW